MDRCVWVVVGRLVLDDFTGIDVTRRQIAALERPSKAKRISIDGPGEG